MVAVLVVVALAVLAHEAGHALAAHMLGLRWKTFARFPISIGIAAEPSRLVALAGPAMSLAGAIIFAPTWPVFAFANLFLGLTALLPIPASDGYRLIRG